MKNNMTNLNCVPAGYTFDDLLLKPKYSTIKSRDSVSLNVNLSQSIHTNKNTIEFSIPIISANMKSVTGKSMALAMAKAGGLGILHRFYDSEHDRLLDLKEVLPNNVGASVGINDSEFEYLEKAVDIGLQVVCVDVAHADNLFALKFVERISKAFPNLIKIVGNVATAAGARRCNSAGADVVKCGIGSGSLCSTRIETGNGVPMMSMLAEIRSDNKNMCLIADGGIRNSGDCVKSLCFADAVMLGNVLAGTDEAPGAIVVDRNGILSKQYAGSSTHKSRYIEGVVGLVPYKGPVHKVLDKVCDGIRSGCSYQGVGNLHDLKLNPEFIHISNAGVIESRPHDVKL